MTTRSDIVRIGFKVIGIGFGITGIYILHFAVLGMIHIIGNNSGIEGLLGVALFIVISIIPLMIAYMLIVKYSAKSIRLFCAFIALAGWLFINSEMNQIIIDPRQYRTDFTMKTTLALIYLAVTIATIFLMRWLYKILARLLIRWAAIDEKAEQSAARDRRETSRTST
jgi:hypothetical protein